MSSISVVVLRESIIYALMFAQPRESSLNPSIMKRIEFFEVQCTCSKYEVLRSLIKMSAACEKDFGQAIRPIPIARSAAIEFQLLQYFLIKSIWIDLTA